jgi:hypothetical protein
MATLLGPVVRSDASFNSRSANPGNTVVADSPGNYVHLYSQGTDPAGLTDYAVKRLSAPAVPAAIGADATVAAALGGNKNVSGQVFTRVITLQAPASLPSGSPLTVTATLAADPSTGSQPISAVAFSNTDGTGAGPTATIPAGAKRQMNVTVTTRSFPGNNRLYTPIVTLTVKFPGYSGTFLTYDIPVSVWDGNGSGP